MATRRVAFITGVLIAATLALSWPGVAMYDSVWQYQQALSGRYNDWHPPVMARLWALLHPLGPGAAPMFLLQVAAYWIGLGLWSAALARHGRGKAAAAVLLVGCCPVFLGWQVIVLKDAQMAAAMLAATGSVAWWRLAGRRIPLAAGVAIGLLLTYAVLVRSNAVFAVVPLAVMLSDWSWRRRILWGIAGIGIVLAVSPGINGRLIGAEHSGVTHAQPLYDLAGIAHGLGVVEPGGLRADERATIEARHCYTPFFWDPLGDPKHCGMIFERFEDASMADLGRTWVLAIVHHPLAYVRHRAAHLNRTWRFIVPSRSPSAAPPLGGEPNVVGLRSPGASHRWLARAGAWVAETPLGWPIVWIALAASVIWATRKMRGTIVDLAVALATSALALEASFALISIASDLRYHLWAMLASALSAVLVSGRVARRDAWIMASAVGFVAAVAIVARIVLPLGPTTYEAMLG